MTNFECNKCGNCCSNYLPLMKHEIHKMKALAMNRDTHKLYVRKDWYSVCPFLNIFNKCDIYEDRPLICQDFRCNNQRYAESLLRNFTADNFTLVDVRKEIFNEKQDKTK